MSNSQEILAFNRGVVSRLALGRLDLKRLAMSAAEQTNWMPRVLGSMMLRPGLGYVGTLLGPTKMLPFVFATDDTAEIEMSAGAMRVWVNDALVTRGAVTAPITNGGFGANIAGWTDHSDATGSTAWVAGGYLGVTGDGTAFGISEQAVATANVGAPHALRIVVAKGPVTLRVGSSSLGSQILADTALGTGTHSIVIVPSGTFYLQFRSRLSRTVLVDSVSVEGAGVLSLPTPYAAGDLPLLRPEESADVVYVACAGRQQRKIERRDNGSWSIVLYEPEDGPSRVENVGPTTLTPSAISGTITLTASDSLFRPTNVGSLYAITSVGQRVETTFGTDNVFGDPIRVAGIGESRRFAIIITGVFVATITLQRSVGVLNAWEDVTTYTTVQDITYNDGLDNQIVYFRLAVKPGAYTSGSAASILNYSSGSIRGVVRITGYTSDVLVTADVLKALGGTDATDVWAEGSWSPRRGYPSSARIHDGRLWWAGKDFFFGSVTDGFESFDPTYVGDAGPIQRSVGSGPIDSVTWMMSLNRLVAGTDGAVVECRSSSLDEPLTPTNFTPKTPATKGSARVDAVKVDDMALFVQRSGFRVLQVTYTIQKQGADLTDLTVLAPEVCEPGIITMAVQREPDTRIHCVLSDGTVAVLLFDPVEDVKCWVKVETQGFVTDVVITPGLTEDAVHYVVRRVIGGVDRYFYERWALESEARRQTWNKLADSFVIASSASSVSLPHLEGQTVVAWGSGRDLGTFEVSGGVIDLGGAFTNVCAGLGYEARFKSTKLAYLVPPGKSGLGARKRLDMLGVVLADAHAQGLQYGRDFDSMDDMPQVEDWGAIDLNAVNEDYEKAMFEFPGEWTIDARLCLRAAAPRPCTVLAAVIGMTTNVK